MARKLRIAASAFFGVLTAILLLLWARSFWRIDGPTLPLSNGSAMGVFSKAGRIHVWTVKSPFGPFWYTQSWNSSAHHRRTPGAEFPTYDATAAGRLDSEWFTFPIWLLAAVCATISGLAIPKWTRPQFSLRTLLIATALIAVALGLVVLLTR